MRGKGLMIASLLAALAVAALPAAAGARAGDLYIGDTGNLVVLKMDPRTGDTEELVPDTAEISFPDGLAFDRRGNIFIADYGPSGSMVDGAVWRLDPRTKALDNVTPAGGGLEQPLDLVVGADGQLYVSDIDTDGVFRVNPTTGAISTVAAEGLFASGGPLGIDRAPSGTLFTVDGDAAATGNAFGAIRVLPGSGATKLVASGPNPSDAYGFALAPNGKTGWVGDTQQEKIFRVNVRTGAVAELNVTGSPIDGPTGLALAPNGDLFVANFDAQNVLRVNTRTGASTEIGSLEPAGNAEGIAIEPPRCGGKFATVVGTTGRDRIKGSRFGDVIATLGGRDTVKGAGGKDIICGGKGRDRLIGGKGGDRLLGGAGNDACTGGPGRDRLRSC